MPRCVAFGGGGGHALFLMELMAIMGQYLIVVLFLFSQHLGACLAEIIKLVLKHVDLVCVANVPIDRQFLVHGSLDLVKKWYNLDQSAIEPQVFLHRKIISFFRKKKL